MDIDPCIRCIYTCGMTKKQKNTGRGKARAKNKTRHGVGKTPLLTLRVERERREKWTRAAEKRGLTLSEWLRQLADAACDQAGGV